MLEGVVSLKDLKIYVNISSSLLSLSLSLYLSLSLSIELTRPRLLSSISYVL